MSVETPPMANENAAAGYGAEQSRRAWFVDYLSTGGVINAGDLLVSVGSGLSVNVAVGQVLIPGTSSTTQGLYFGQNMSTTNLTLATANGTNPRIDMICATVQDSAYAGANDLWELQAVTGTPTSGATLSNLSGAPALPVSSLLIAYVLVPANAVSLTSGDLLDERIRAQQNSPIGQLFTSSGTYLTPNDGLTHTYRFTLCGAGGGGGGGIGNTSTGYAGAGGGAGAFVQSSQTVAPNTTLTVTVGAGGTAGTAGGAGGGAAGTGGTGGTTSVSGTGVSLSASPGAGGVAGSASTAATGGLPGGLANNPAVTLPLFGAGGSSLSAANGNAGSASWVGGGGGGAGGGVGANGGGGGTAGSPGNLGGGGTRGFSGSATGVAGASAAANSGSGGGGGGAGASGGAGGAGGTGGSGWVLIERIA